jgi:polyketide biosynthesis enoyl-CoA hydratase PksI
MLSDVVNLRYHSSSIAVIKMEDKKNKNMFSQEIIDGLNSAFSQIEKDQDIKCVIIHGYDNYFSCGGTKEEITRIHKGEITFVDLNFYDLMLRCKVPVIAAVNGHAIGGGLVFAAYADHIILAKECIYTANFMNYGFTPGLGATCILPYKFGNVLADEMMFSGANYNGASLKARGCPLIVENKKDVYDRAILLAEQIAEKPLQSLKLLKHQRSKKIKEELSSAVADELDMHKISFSQPEVKEKIDALLGTSYV